MLWCFGLQGGFRTGLVLCHDTSWHQTFVNVLLVYAYNDIRDLELRMWAWLLACSVLHMSSSVVQALRAYGTELRSKLLGALEQVRLNRNLWSPRKLPTQCSHLCLAQC